jgi:predicted regulator of amino acid metabolism with ACT domain
MNKIILLTLCTLLFFSCKHELENPTWDVDMIVPLVHSQMNIDNMLSDSNLNIVENEEGYISLFYQEDLLNINYDSLITLETKSEEKSIRIDSVNFNDVVIEQIITIGSVISELPFGTILFPDGSQREIPAMAGIVQNDTIPIDASDYFQTMTLYNGMLNLKLTNGFPTDISNVSFSLYNATNLNLIATFFTPLIESGNSYSESVSIAGETLDYKMVGIINNMDIEASNGLVSINYSDAMTTKISITEIQIMEATAYFPNQLLHEENVEQSFKLGLARLTEIGIKEGTVIINAISTLPDTGTIIYAIPSLSKNGFSFETSVKIPPNTNGVMTQFVFDFSGYTMDLTGKYDREGGDTVNTIYATLQAYLDSTGELETIHQVDSFYLFNEYNFIPEYAIGYLGQDTLLNGPENIDTDVFKFISSGTVDLEKVEMSIAVVNYIGADAALVINDLSASNATTTVSAAIDNAELHHVARATLNSNGTIIPTNTTIALGVDELLEIFPNKLTTYSTIYLNPNAEASTADFLYIEQPMKATLGVEIPLSFIANNLALSKTSDLETDNIEEIEVLYITIENGLPLEANLILVALDDANQIIDTLISNNTILAAITNAQGIVTENRTSVIEIKNTNFEGMSKLQSTAVFNTEFQTDFVRIYDNYTMNIILSAKFSKIIGE